MPEHWFTKAVGGFLLAIPMYWAQVPEPIAIMMGMMGVDIVVSAVAKWLKGDFSFTLFFQGIVLRSLSIPVLWACHLAELGLRIEFDVKVYVSYAMTAATFIAIMERYIALGGSGGPWIQEILDRVKTAMQTHQAQAMASSQVAVVTDKFETVAAGPDGTLHTQTVEASKVIPRSDILKP